MLSTALHVFALSFDWFIGLSVSVVIGQSNNLGFSLVLRHSIENHSKYDIYLHVFFFLHAN